MREERYMGKMYESSSPREEVNKMWREQEHSKGFETPISQRKESRLEELQKAPSVSRRYLDFSKEESPNVWMEGNNSMSRSTEFGSDAFSSSSGGTRRQELTPSTYTFTHTHAHNNPNPNPNHTHHITPRGGNVGGPHRACSPAHSTPSPTASTPDFDWDNSHAAKSRKRESFGLDTIKIDLSALLNEDHDHDNHTTNFLSSPNTYNTTDSHMLIAQILVTAYYQMFNARNEHISTLFSPNARFQVIGESLHPLPFTLKCLSDLMTVFVPGGDSYSLERAKDVFIFNVSGQVEHKTGSMVPFNQSFAIQQKGLFSESLVAHLHDLDPKFHLECALQIAQIVDVKLQISST